MTLNPLIFSAQTDEILGRVYHEYIIFLGTDRYLGPIYKVSGTRDNPSPETTLRSVYRKFDIC